MDDALRIVAEMHQSIWERLRRALEDLNPEEIQWRFLPQASSISLIIRHLRIEAAWHLASLERGEPMPTIAAPVHQKDVDAVPFDFEENLDALEGKSRRFVTSIARHAASRRDSRQITQRIPMKTLVVSRRPTALAADAARRERKAARLSCRR